MPNGLAARTLPPARRTTAGTALVTDAAHHIAHGIDGLAINLHCSGSPMCLAVIRNMADERARDWFSIGNTLGLQLVPLTVFFLDHLVPDTATGGNPAALDLPLARIEMVQTGACAGPGIESAQQHMAVVTDSEV